jgi:hypothetical protein
LLVVMFASSRALLFFFLSFFSFDLSHWSAFTPFSAARHHHLTTSPRLILGLCCITGTSGCRWYWQPLPGFAVASFRVVTGISNENDDIASLLWLHLGPFCFGWVITGGLMMAALSLLGETETRVGAPGCWWCH